MSSSPGKFLFFLVLTCIVGWLVFMFASRLFAWLLGRVTGTEIRFRIAGWNCLRDISIKFNKGALESIVVGEIKLSLRKSLVKLGVGFIYKDPKLQLLICDLEVSLRQSEKKQKKATPRKPHSSGRGNLMVLANIARFLSVSVSELVVKTPKAISHVKELGVELFRSGGQNKSLSVKVHVFPLTLLMGESRLNNGHSGSLFDRQASLINSEKNGVPFSCEELSITSEFGHERDMGIQIISFDVNVGNVAVNLNEDFFCKSTALSDTSGSSEIKNNLERSSAMKSHKDRSSLLKNLFLIPKKVSFSLPKLDVRFMHRGLNLLVENNVTGIQLRSTSSIGYDDFGDSFSHLDVQLDLREIHILKEGQCSIVEMLKVSVITNIDVLLQRVVPIKADIDIKLGGAQINIITSRLVPLLRLQKSKQKKMSLREKEPCQEHSPVAKTAVVAWTCKATAPEMIIVLYSIKGLPLYHGFSQSSHVLANNISSQGMQLHAELGELHLNMADRHQECLKENVFGIEASSESLMHIVGVQLDWGHKEMESAENQGADKSKLIFSVDVTRMGMHFSFHHVESIVTTMMSFKTILQSLPTEKLVHEKAGRSSRKLSKGLQIIKIKLGQCAVIFFGEVGVEDTIVADPKRVNYGSQGGEIIFTMSADGTPRKACITSAVPDGSKLLRNSLSLDVIQLNFLVNKDKKSTRIEFQRVRSFYKEYLEEQNPCTTINLLDLYNARIVRRPGGVHETSICSLFGASNVILRWEPDVHVALYELILRVKFLVHREKSKISSEVSEVLDKDLEPGKELVVDSLPMDKQHRKKESIFAVDIETLMVSAELADGVEASINVRSIFSENARIGILLEGLTLGFNDCRVLKSSRMQISRLPVFSTTSPDLKTQVILRWDWVIQGLDITICLPYRLQLRAIDDAFEDTLRALKLVLAAKSNIIFPIENDSPKKKRSGSSKFGSIKFIVRKISAEIEEEPLQGWLDEHYHILKNEMCELAVRMKFFDDVVSEGIKHLAEEQNEVTEERKFRHDGEFVDVHDKMTLQNLQEELHKRTFRSYHSACKKIEYSEGSGACSSGFQSGFKLSKSRASLLSISATELELVLTAIDGGDIGMIEFIKNLDPVAKDSNIPFSRLYGRDMVLNTSSLVAQLRDYPFPLFSGVIGRSKGRIVLAQQATCFQPQIEQDVYVGRWRKVRMLRSASGTTPAVKTYSSLPIIFQKGEVCFGVGFEPVLADVSYAFTVALRRANLSTRSYDPNFKNLYYPNQLPKKERSLPWWDDMRYYIHGGISLSFSETKWNILSSTNPYEKLNKLQLLSATMDIFQSDGRVTLSAKELKIFLSSVQSLISSHSLKEPTCAPVPFLECPSFSVEIDMEWGCDSSNPLNHYLHALPVEGVPREKVLDPFRSTSLSLRWNFSLRSSPSSCSKLSVPPGMVDDGFLGQMYEKLQKPGSVSLDLPTVTLGPHDLVWIIKFWNLNYLPPHKLRSFSRWPRFGVPRIARSGNLALDRVMTEFFLRIDSVPAYIRHISIVDDDPASGLTIKISKVKFEHCFSRGKQQYTFDSKREPLDLVYQGLNLHTIKACFIKEGHTVNQDNQTVRTSQSGTIDKIITDKSKSSGCNEKGRDAGFLLYADYFSIRKQAPKADSERLQSWQDIGRKNLEIPYIRSEFANNSESDHTRSDPSDGDDDGFDVVVADNCQRVFVYGLKLLWNIDNRNAILSWVGGLTKAFEPAKPSPSRLYAQRQSIEEQHKYDEPEAAQDEMSNSNVAIVGGSSPSEQHEIVETLSSGSLSSIGTEDRTSDGIAKNGFDNNDEGTRNFMVNIIQPQFNLHSEEANGRFLLAAASGRVLARSFHSVVHIGYEVIEKTLGATDVKCPMTAPELTWKRAELSVMLEHVQSHVAPTDVDPGAGIQWLPKILGSSPKVKRTGALLERVFMPCQMYFRYTRHKHDSAEWKLKPLKELNFNSPNITANMTSRQFQVMLDVLTNLLFARVPKLHNNYLVAGDEDDEIDETVPDGIEEVELAKIKLEQNERERKLLLNDIRTLLASGENLNESSFGKGSDFWMIGDGRLQLVQRLNKDLVAVKTSRKTAHSDLRMALQKAAQLRLMEKEKNKSPSSAMRVSVKINKVVWSMLTDGRTFAEAEITDMTYNFDRDYKDIGVGKFTIKCLEVKNWLPNAKSTTVLSPWNAPTDWGKKVMLRVDARQGVPKDGTSPLELFQVEIYPLKIHLTETMYRRVWGYFFPEEEQDSHRRQEVWKVSTTSSSKRGKKIVPAVEAISNPPAKEPEAPVKSSAIAVTSSIANVDTDSSHPSKLQSQKVATTGSKAELRRTSSLDRTWEENVAEFVANELVLQVQSSSSKNGSVNSAFDDESSKVKLKDSKLMKSGARSLIEEKKVAKPQEEKKSKKIEFQNIKISQVELLVTYEGSRFAFSDLRLLMDSFHRVDFTGTWGRLFSRVKKHIIWGVLKSVTGMQGKKFKVKSQSQRDGVAPVIPDIDINLSDSDEDQPGNYDYNPIAWPKRQSDGAGDGFVTSIKGLFSSQRRRAKKLVLRTMKGDTGNDFHGEWSEGEVEFSPYARQLTISKTKKLIRHHTKKFISKGHKISGSTSKQKASRPSSPTEVTTDRSDSSGALST